MRWMFVGRSPEQVPGDEDGRFVAAGDFMPDSVDTSDPLFRSMVDRGVVQQVPNASPRQVRRPAAAKGDTTPNEDA